MHKLEVVEHWMITETNLARHHDAFRFHRDAGELDRPRRPHPIHTVQAGKKMEMPLGATKLAVRDGLEPRLLLLGYKRADTAVLDGAQTISVQQAFGEAGSRVL
jgi:hypothetical protein